MVAEKSLVIYLPNLASGGVERLHLNLAPAFIAAGYQVTFLLQRREGGLLSSVPAGVRVVSLDCQRTLASFRPLIAFLRRERPALFVANMGHGNIVALWAAALSGVRTRVIACQHNTLSLECKGRGQWQYRVLPLLYRLFLGRADRIVAVSNGVADDLSAMTGIARGKISVIYNPVITADFAARMQAPAGHPWFNDGGPPVVLGVGRLMPQKDFATLLCAIAIVNETRPVRLMLLGEGELKDDLLAEAQRRGIAGSLALPGFQANPLPFMRAAALVAMSSLYEGFGNVLVEAMACGTPVVSTACPHGPAEILQDGRYGRLTPVGDDAALAAAIVATLDNPLPAEILMARGNEFTVQRACDEYVALFTSL